MNKNTEACIFCKIVQKEMSAHIINETEYTLTFLDIYPSTKGHALVIPKTHVEKIEDASELVLSTLLAGVQKSISVLQDALSPEAFSIGWNNGQCAGQVVPHLHVHVLPRWESDGGGSMHTIIQKKCDSHPEDILHLFTHPLVCQKD